MAEAMRIFWENYWKFLPSAPQTRAHKRRIVEFFKDRFIDTISKHDIENYRRYLAELGLKPQTVNKGHTMLARMFTKLEEYREAKSVNGMDFKHIILPEKNPCAMVPKVNELQFARKQILSEEQFQKLVFYMDDDMKETLLAYLETGLRPSDLTRLNSSNVDLTHAILRGIQHKTITTRNPSGVPYLLKVSGRMKDILLRRMALTEPGKPLFPHKNWERKWNWVRKQAGLEYIQRRDLRRTKGSFLLDNGIDPLTVANSLGLTTLRLLPTYTARNLSQQQVGVEKIEEKFK
jgi:integrase